MAQAIPRRAASQAVAATAATKPHATAAVVQMRNSQIVRGALKSFEFDSPLMVSVRFACSYLVSRSLGAAASLPAKTRRSAHQRSTVGLEGSLPSAADSGAHEERRRRKAVSRLVHRRRDTRGARHGIAMARLSNRGVDARCAVVAASVRRTVWMSASTRSAASMLSCATYSKISSRSANASGWNA